MRFSKIAGTAAKYKWFLVFFPIFLGSQLYQASFFRWDAAVYELEGKWFCGEKLYFEFLRAPLTGAIHCAVGAGQYTPALTVILASVLYLIALILIFKKEPGRNNQLVFAAFSLLFPTILWNSNFGSDLFALAFLLIALSIRAEAKGLAFGLATLSRYNFIFYAPVFLLQLKPRQWPAFFLGILATWTPWLLFNYAQTGNPLFSVEDFVYLNFVQKGIAAPLGIDHAILILFFLASVFVATGLDIKNLKNALFQVGLLGILQFLVSGVKETRFLNILVPAQASFLAKKTSKPAQANFAKALLALLAISALLAPLFYYNPSNQKQYAIPDDVKLKECRVMSDHWLRFYEKGIIAEPLPREDDFDYFLKSGVNLVVYDQKVGLQESPDYEIIKGDGYSFFKPRACEPQPQNYTLKVWRGDWRITQ